MKFNRSKSLEDEFKTRLESDILERIKSGTEENLMWYVVVRSVQRFKSLHSRLPNNFYFEKLKVSIF